MRWASLLLLAACAASDGGSTARMRSVEELPEAHRETWVAWVERDPRWPELRERALADEELTAFLVDNLARVMLKSYRSGEIAGVHDPEVGPFERARAELLRLGAPAVPTLAELMAIGDGTAAYLCRDLLVEIGRPAIDYAVGLLERESATARARAAQVLAHLPHAGDGEAAVQAALACRADEDEWQVREQAVIALGHRGARDARTDRVLGPLSRALADEDPAVARAAAAALTRCGDPRAVPALMNFLQRAHRDADLVSYQAGQQALQALTGTSRPRTPREWRDLWRSRKPVDR